MVDMFLHKHKNDNRHKNRRDQRRNQYQKQPPLPNFPPTAKATMAHDGNDGNNDPAAQQRHRERAMVGLPSTQPNKQRTGVTGNSLRWKRHSATHDKREEAATPELREWKWAKPPTK